MSPAAAAGIVDVPQLAVQLAALRCKVDQWANKAMTTAEDIAHNHADRMKDQSGEREGERRAE
jgi:hypothetical protein